MKTIFPKKENHIPKWFVLDAENKTLGRLATEASKLLRGKENSYYTPGVNQGNFVVILNADKISITGKKELQKLYYRHSHRPGSMKIENFKQLKDRIPSRILEKAIWGMLPKGSLGRDYYRRLYIYKDSNIHYKKSKDGTKKVISTADMAANNWIQLDI
jgi:large subunit ribosomal protein L13